MIQLRHWLSAGKPVLLAILLDVHQTLYTDAISITIYSHHEHNENMITLWHHYQSVSAHQCPDYLTDSVHPAWLGLRRVVFTCVG